MTDVQSIDAKIDAKDAVDRVDTRLILDVLVERGRCQRDDVVFEFLVDGARQVESLTYGQLDERVRAVAGEIVQRDLAGQRVVLLAPPGLEFISGFFGILRAGAVAVPTYPPTSARRQSLWARLRAVIADCRPEAILTSSELQSSLSALLPDRSDGQPIPLVATDALARAQSTELPALPAADDIACIQYTSGSTTESSGDESDRYAARGVVLTHGNLAANTSLIQAALGSTEQSRGVIWLPPYHDMGLIGGILQPLYCGFPVTLMSPAAFIQKPIRWLETIARVGGTISAAPCSAYEMCVERTTPAQREGLDLSTWAVACNGAEPIDAGTVERFIEAFAPCGFRAEAMFPCYGLAEATLMVTGSERQSSPVVRSSAIESANQLVGSGRVQAPFARDTVFVVDSDRRYPVPDREEGEIWVRGPHVAKGYWNRPDLTETSFVPGLDGVGPGPWLRTGDLGFVDDGELFVTGRTKDVIIVRGVNHAAADLERTATGGHEAVARFGVAAFETDVDGRSGPVIVAELKRDRRDADPDEVIRGIRRAVSDEHEIALRVVALVRPGALPRTPSGKLQRAVCREGLRAGDLETIEIWHGTSEGEPDEGAASKRIDEAVPRTVEQIEHWLVARMAGLLKVSMDEIEPGEPFARYGLESIDAAELAIAIVDRWTLELPPTVFWDYPSVGELARFIAEQAAPQANEPSSEPAPTGAEPV